MKRTCRICSVNYELTSDEIEYLVQTKMIHPFVCCKTCSVKDVAELAKETQDEMILKLGSPDGRAELWKIIFEENPEVRTAYVLKELEIS